MFRRIYLSGGGMNGISIVGALQELERQNYLCFIGEWIGISSGALEAMLFVLGYTIKQGLEILKIDFQQITEPDPGWLLNMGYDTGNRLLKFLFALLKEKGFQERVTFQELFQLTGKSFRTFATDIQSGSLAEFSKEKTPDYPIAYAARASMSFPYYFQPFKCPLTNKTYSDGGLVSNFPLQYITEEERMETLAISINYAMAEPDLQDLTNFLWRPMKIFMLSRSQSDCIVYPHQTIVISLDKSQVMDFEMSLEEKMNLVAKGQIAVVDFIKKYRKPARRYSVS